MTDLATDVLKKIQQVRDTATAAGHGYSGIFVRPNAEWTALDAGNCRLPYDVRHAKTHSPDAVELRCDMDKLTVVRCQEALLSGNSMLVHFAKETLRERAQAYGVVVRD